MPNTTISIEMALRDRLKTFGHAGMTYNEILARMMDEIEREAFVQEMRRILTETKPQEWVDFNDIEWGETAQVRTDKRTRVKGGSRPRKTRPT